MVARALDVWGRKVARLPERGVLLCATDLQGNYDDYERLLTIYDAEKRAGNEPILALCGDLVHGPSPDMHQGWPSYLGTEYRDESARLIKDFERFTREERAFSVLGNHEHAHIGGPVVPKFYPDEAAILDATLGEERYAVHDFLRTWPLMAVAPNGIVLTHGSPRQTAESIEAFERFDYAGYERVPIFVLVELNPLGSLLWARGCTDADALAFLQVTQGRDAGVVVHGHDVVREGYDKGGAHHICVSTSFGLFNQDKVYLRLDLAGRYESTEDLREGHEILPLYG